jgi:hypothetical protein
MRQTGEERDARIDIEEMARPGNGCKLTLAMVDAYADMGAHLVRLAQPSAKSTNAPASSCQLASPSLSEFENFLGEREANLQTQTIKQGSDKFVVYERPANVSNNEWWESVLTSEKERLEQNKNSRTVDVADILPEEASSDDDIPIVSTLPSAKAKRKVLKKRLPCGHTKRCRSPPGPL